VLFSSKHWLHYPYKSYRISGKEVSLASALSFHGPRINLENANRLTASFVRERSRGNFYPVVSAFNVRPGIKDLDRKHPGELDNFGTIDDLVSAGGRRIIFGWRRYSCSFRAFQMFAIISFSISPNVA
jgi:hypothetical protein